MKLSLLLQKVWIILENVLHMKQCFEYFAVQFASYDPKH